MSFLDRIKRNTASKPPMMLVYGVAGVGKTSLGAAAPAPIFLQTEDGLGTLPVDTFGLLRSFDAVTQAIGELYSEAHDFKTVVLDSVDHLEPLVWAQTCKDNGWKSVEEPGYGRGYVATLDLWRFLLDGLRTLRDERDMTVLLLAHNSIVKFTSPDTEAYDRYMPKLHKSASALVQEIMDAVLFVNYRVSTVKSEAGGFNKTTVRGVGAGERLIYTEERPAFIAKQRYDMPPSLPMTWDAIAEHIPALRDAAPAATTANAA